MYNIAIIAANKKFDSEYIKALEKENCTVTLLDSQQTIKNKLQNMDLVIIEELHVDNIGRTCEIIVETKKSFEGPVWTFSRASKKSNRIIYLQLGVDGNIHSTTAPDEFALFISVQVQSWKKKQVTLTKEPSRSEGQTKFEILSDIKGVRIPGQKDILLTSLEYRLLVALSDKLNEVITYEDLFEHIWGVGAKVSVFRLANAVSNLRKKIEIGTGSTKYIKNIRSKGYMLVS